MDDPDHSQVKEVDTDTWRVSCEDAASGEESFDDLMLEVRVE